jgi:hypothetical protein
LWIPDDLQLRKQIMEVQQDLKAAGLMGQDKTIKLVRRNFFWPEREKFINDYVRSCLECLKNKAAYHAWYRLLQLFELADRPGAENSIHFMIEISISDRCLLVWIIFD